MGIIAEQILEEYLKNSQIQKTAGEFVEPAVKYELLNDQTEDLGVERPFYQENAVIPDAFVATAEDNLDERYERAREGLEWMTGQEPKYDAGSPDEKENTPAPAKMTYTEQEIRNLAAQYGEYGAKMALLISILQGDRATAEQAARQMSLEQVIQKAKNSGVVTASKNHSLKAEGEGMVQDKPEDLKTKYDNPSDLGDLIEKAHPESIYVADDRYDGGLVENQNEQREKIEQVMNKMPTGNLVHFRYASVAQELVKIAEEMEEEGADLEAIRAVDETLQSMLKKKAALPLIPILIGGAVLGVSAGLWDIVTGIQEGLATDTRDLYYFLKPLPSEHPQTADAGRKIVSDAQQASALAQKVKQKFSERKIDSQFYSDLNTIEVLLQQIETGIDQVAANKEGVFPTRVGLISGSKIDDIRDDIDNLKKAAEKLKQQGQDIRKLRQTQQMKGAPLEVDKPEGTQPLMQNEDKIRKIQVFVNKYFSRMMNSPIEVTGELDQQTLDHFREIARYIRQQFGTEKYPLRYITPESLSNLSLNDWESLREKIARSYEIMVGSHGLAAE